ncbi:glucose PTS transporter transcription antiterminator GlcT [Lederbergia citrea]|uniref:Transcription antiterminator n=1 Tax=Lederbergia citrea TaxID=2833581 RepID=A0A942Z703_9BACI|nr:transcription antiterminator [Lederbergia citrea]MBS4179277.1 transcription antiterminator [Lederbergia citrea]MBS4205940.1 transcription antiterminator [Lederbergia citrea]MBS4224611.1 transcription antiterminator [Lederbergia citrea]
MEKFLIKKSLNNNVLIATDVSGNEVILIGRGIGFSRQSGDHIVQEKVEKMFVLKDPDEQTQYKQLLSNLDDEKLKVIISAVEIIHKRAGMPLNEHIHVALTDHLVFAVNRMKKGMGIRNPFLLETKGLYPKEFEIAAEVTEMINKHLTVELPEGEIGFIALHIHSALVNKNVRDLALHSDLIVRLVKMIEEQFDIEIDKSSIDYMRLIRHLHFTIERVVRGEEVAEPEKITSLLKTEYPICYNLAWKLIKVMQQTLKKHVYDAEAVYLTLHLQRIQTKMK